MTKSPKKHAPAAQAAKPPAPGPTVPGATVPGAPVPLTGTGAPGLQVNVSPAAARRLSEDGLRRLAAAQQAEANLPGWQSLGRGGKPDHANGRQGPRQRKVRW